MVALTAPRGSTVMETASACLNRKALVVSSWSYRIMIPNMSPMFFIGCSGLEHYDSRDYCRY